MAIQRWDPLHDVLQLQDRMNRLFDDVLARSGGLRVPEAVSASGWKPAVDILEEGERYVLKVDLPGMKAPEVSIEVEDETLCLRGERKVDPSVPKESYLRVERPHGRFVLQLALPASVDRQGIKARHEDGVLEILLPKRRNETPGRVRIDVV